MGGREPLNRSTLTIKIKSFLWLCIYLVSFLSFFRDMLRVSDAVFYVIDGIVFGLFFVTVAKNIAVFQQKSSRMLQWVIGFFLTTLVGFLVSNYSLLLYLWGFRNIFRFYLFFMLCVVYFRKSDVERLFSFFEKLLYLNVAAATYELFLGFKGDFIGGTFGVLKGGNAYLNLLMVIITAIYITRYLEKQAGIAHTLLTVALCIYLMAIAEIKIYVFELPIIIVVAMANAKFSWRKIMIVLLAAAGVIAGISLMSRFFSTSNMSFFTSGKLWDYIGDNGYTNAGDLNRFNAIPKITTLFFRGDIFKLLFGFGLGNCSYSGFAALTSAFYRAHGWMHYQWFSDAWVYLETGAIGLLMYELFFVAAYLAARRYLRAHGAGTGETVAVKTVTVIALCCVLNTVYNCVLNMEAGYLAYAMLACPWILREKQGVG